MTTPVRQPVDLLTHSPDGESRGLIFRAGDLFPLDPTQHLMTGTFDAATEVRPWGLRYLSGPRPCLPTGKGKHEGPTNDTSGGTPDGQGPSKEETKRD
jgi:hypothetical protein